MMNLAMLRNFPTSGHRMACSSAAVWFCGIEPTNRPRNHASFLADQDSPLSKSKSPGLTNSLMSDLPARCQASVAVCPLPIRQVQEEIELESLDLDVDTQVPEMLDVDRSLSPLPRSFLAQASSGQLVECSSRGCRPLLTCSVPEYLVLQAVEDAAQVMTSNHTGMNSSSPRGASEMLLRSSKISAPPTVSKMDKISAAKHAYEAAIEAAPFDAQLLSEFAVFAWKSLEDLDVAEELYNKALEISPNDSNILASYALFLWQSDQ